MIFLNNNIKIIANNKKARHDYFILEKKKEVFHYEGGIKEFVKHQNKNKEPIHPDIIYFEVTKEEYEVEIAMQYTDRYSEVILSYANNINTMEGGSHLVGFKSALTRVFNDYARKTKALKENDENLAGEDVRERDLRR